MLLEDQSIAMVISCSKDLNKFRFQYLHIIKVNMFICAYGYNPSDGKLLPKVEVEGRISLQKDLLVSVFWGNSQNTERSQGG